MSTAVALQRLRQGQGRCQQLASLLQWHQQAGGPATAREQQRGAADQATAFARERKGFERSLGELRKQWAKERLEKEAARAVAEAAERAAREAAKAQRKQQDLEAKARRLQEYQAKQAAAAELRAAAKAQRLKREELRLEVMDVAREERRRLLLRQSCSWVTEQTLDQRIEEALDNPVPLHADTPSGV